jgi:hypothetical protein
LSVDDAGVYWTNLALLPNGQAAGNGTVNTCALSGCDGGPGTLAGGQPNPEGILVFGGAVYWANVGSATNGPTIGRCQLGATPSCGTWLTFTAEAPVKLATDGARLYWTTTANNLGSCALGATCGGPTKVATASSYPSSLTVDSKFLYFTTQGSAQANFTDGAVWSCPTSGCGASPTQIVGAQWMPYAIAVDGTSVYWGNLGARTVARCPLALGCLAAAETNLVTLASGQAGVVSMTVDRGTLYWVAANLGTVAACAVTGCSGEPTVLASGSVNPYALALTPELIVWASAGHGGSADGTIARLAR